MNLNFQVNKLKEVSLEDRGQANKILAYVDGDITVDGQKITQLNGLKFEDSKYYGKQIVEEPQIRGSDGQYRRLYNLSPELNKLVLEAVLHAYEAKRNTDTKG